MSARAAMGNAGRAHLDGLAPQPREFRAAAFPAEVDTRHLLFSRKMTKPTKIERMEKTLLKNSLRFCQADARVQLARRQRKELRDLHDPEDGVCCLPSGNQSDEEGSGRKALPREKWCEHCRRITSEAISYGDALWERRAAKTGMKRVHKLLCKLKSNSN